VIRGHLGSDPQAKQLLVRLVENSSMHAPRRAIVPGLPHHVIHRGNNRRILVSTAFDYSRLLHFIADAARRFDCPVHALALMSNHLHLIAKPETTRSLSAFVNSFANRYARYRNRRRKASGKLFEERYLRFPLHTDVAVGVGPHSPS
jgi:putative transposase